MSHVKLAFSKVFSLVRWFFIGPDPPPGPMLFLLPEAGPSHQEEC